MRPGATDHAGYAAQILHSWICHAAQLCRTGRPYQGSNPRPRVSRGDRLPSVRELAAAQSVSVSTATRCYRLLEHEGYAQARYKSGMYVADWKALRQARAAPETRRRPAPAGVEYDMLASLQHRMTQLYALTAQPLPLALHLASAAPEWYPCETLARIAQRLLRENHASAGRLSVRHRPARVQA